MIKEEQRNMSDEDEVISLGMDQYKENSYGIVINNNNNGGISNNSFSDF